MHVLVVDPDEEFGPDLVKQLGAGGVNASHATSPDKMSAFMRIHSIDVVVVDLSLRRMDGFVVARQLRFEIPAHELEIVLMSPRHRKDSPEIVSLMRDSQARFFYEKPLAVEKLIMDLKSRKPVSAPEPAAVSSRPTHVGVATTPAPRKPSTAAAAPSKSVQARSQFKPVKERERPKSKFKISWVDARGLLSLWAERKSGVLSISTPTGMEQAKLSNGGLVDLEERSVVKRVLRGDQYAFNAQEMGEHGDWARFGRLIFKGACAASDDRTLRRYLSAIPAKSQYGELIRSLPLSKESRKFVAQVDGERPVSEVLERAEVSAGDVSSEVEALVQLKLLEFVSGEQSLGDAVKPNAPSTASVSNSNVIVNVEAADSDAAVLQRLEREMRTIADAVPAVVLGIPQDSDQPIVDTAAERMRQRYAVLIARRTGDARIRELAFQICKRVDEAHKSFERTTVQQFAKSHSKPEWEADEVSLLLEQGKAFIAQSEWSAADEALTKGHEKRLDNVPVLANLGWARLHNPNLDVEKRTEEGRDFLLLAEQFDPHDADGQYYLAQVLVASGRLDAAEERAARAMKSMPDEPRRAALHRQIRIKIARLAEGGKG